MKTTAPKIHYFGRKNSLVLLYTIATLGMYATYWFYRQWKAVGTGTKTNNHPIIRAVFEFVTVFPLFIRIYRESGSTSKLLPLTLAISYVASLIVGIILVLIVNDNLAVLFLSLASSAISGLILFAVQSNITKKLPTAKDHAYRPVEVLFIVFGSLGLISTILSAIFIAPFATIDSRTIEIDARVNAQTRTTDKLLADYEACAATLNDIYPTVDTEDEVAVNEYEQKRLSCEKVGEDLNKENAKLLTILPDYFKAFLR